jgi:uncharacterized protein (TIGR03792 family)
MSAPRFGANSVESSLKTGIVIHGKVVRNKVDSKERMEIEWLKVRVSPELREQYVQKDAEIWTTFLAKYPGFLNKEVWISPDNLAEVILVIHWASFEAWKAIPADELERVEAEFNQAMGNTYTIVESGRYQVRKRFQAQET